MATRTTIHLGDFLLVAQRKKAAHLALPVGRIFRELRGRLLRVDDALGALSHRLERVLVEVNL